MTAESSFLAQYLALSDKLLSWQYKLLITHTLLAIILIIFVYISSIWIAKAILKEDNNIVNSIVKTINCNVIVLFTGLSLVEATMLLSSMLPFMALVSSMKMAVVVAWPIGTVVSCSIIVKEIYHDISEKHNRVRRRENQEG
jgi:hypothetical protein